MPRGRSAVSSRRTAGSPNVRHRGGDLRGVVEWGFGPETYRARAGFRAGSATTTTAGVVPIVVMASSVCFALPCIGLCAPCLCCDKTALQLIASLFRSATLLDGTLGGMLLRHPAFLAVIGAFGVFLVALGGITIAIAAAPGAVTRAVSESLIVRVTADGMEQTIPLVGVDCRVRPATGVAVTGTPNGRSDATFTAKYFQVYDSYQTEITTDGFVFRSSAPFEWDEEAIRFDATAGAVNFYRQAINGGAFPVDVEASLTGTLACRSHD